MLNTFILAHFTSDELGEVIGSQMYLGVWIQ